MILEIISGIRTGDKNWLRHNLASHIKIPKIQFKKLPGSFFKNVDFFFYSFFMQPKRIHDQFVIVYFTNLAIFLFTLFTVDTVTESKHGYSATTLPQYYCHRVIFYGVNLSQFVDLFL